MKCFISNQYQLRGIWPKRALRVELIAVSKASADHEKSAGPMNKQRNNNILFA
jgi:hypothetical protein